MTRQPASSADIRTAYLLLSPAVLLLLIVLAYPLGWEVWTSFTSLSPLQEGATAFVGLDELSPAARRPPVLAGGHRHRRLRGRHERGEAGARARLRPAARPAVPGPGPRLPGHLPPLGVSRERERDRLVLDAEPADPHRLRPLHGPAEVQRRQRLRRRGLGLPQRHPVQHLARQLLHRRAAAGRHQRHPARAVRVRAPGIEERVAPLPAGDRAAAQAVPRAGGVPLAHERLRRPRQRLDAHRGPHRLPRHRHPRLLARHQGRSVRARLGAVADAGSVPARRSSSCCSGSSIRRSGRPHEPEALVGEARPRGADPAGHGLLPLPDLLHAGAVAEDRPGGRLRQSAHRA